MLDRRDFLMKMSATAGAFSLIKYDSQQFWTELADADARVSALSAEDVARNEDYWIPIQQAYPANPALINLNNGGVSPQPFVVQESFMHFNRMANDAPSYYMWRTLDAGREPLRERLAKLGGCSPEEISICRNTTEGLDNVIFGLDLKAGDEVILTKQDYPNMVNAWKQREKRDGIVLKWINFELPIEDDEAFVRKFEEAITPKTKVIHITHMINWVGQIQPIAKIAQMARSKGIATIADGAHTFAHFEFKIPDLGCDYFATSLHKWLSAPFGSGMLYVKKDKIKNIWASFPNHMIESEDIRKFEGLGTRSIPTEMAINTAIDFHMGIGPARKEARLRYLKNYWAKEAEKISGVKLHTSLKKEYSCALALFSIEGKTPGDIASHLETKYKLHVVAIEWENIKGVRVTPHVYSKLSDLDRLLEGINDLAKKQASK